jgi:hypothetical protein
MGRETCGSGLGKRWREKKNCRQEKWGMKEKEGKESEKKEKKNA